ncbi:LicD family protein [uncultured Lutibacter sp.]|uniref:LicD family protein n=1 Tax=uncultured Lutibacter sp. TaxID=437739 RepID=UPI00262F7954|nr:LicD family protein [uncultured Lutibacter sp.]
MAYNITLTGKNNKEALDLLELSAKIMNTCKLVYWLEGGTLLGIRRENRLLPWDNDLDFSLMYPGKPKLDTLINQLKSEGLRVRVRKFKNTLPFKNGDLRIIKVRKKKLFGLLKGNVCLDIFIKYNYNEKAYWQIGNKVKNVPYKFYATVKEIKFNNYSYSIPKLTDEYLTYRYGNWKVPVKNWNTFTDDNALS